MNSDRTQPKTSFLLHAISPATDHGHKVNNASLNPKAKSEIFGRTRTWSHGGRFVQPIPCLSPFCASVASEAVRIQLARVEVCAPCDLPAVALGLWCGPLVYKATRAAHHPALHVRFEVNPAARST